MTPSKAITPHSNALELFAQAVEDIPWAGEVADATQVTEAIILRIMTETDPDKVGASGTVSLKELAGEDIMITSVVKRQSDINKGAAYFQLTAHNLGAGFDGEEFLISTGSAKVCAIVARLHQLKALPAKRRVFAGVAKESGNTFYDLLPVE